MIDCGKKAMNEQDEILKAASNTGICIQCRCHIADLSLGPMLCDTCLDDRRHKEEMLSAEVRELFNLKSSPGLRSCFLKILLSGGLDLGPSGWKVGLALGYELVDAGLREDAEQILTTASGCQDKAKRLAEVVCGDRRMNSGSWTCQQIRNLETNCSGCSMQFQSEARTSITEMCCDRPTPLGEARVFNSNKQKGEAL